MTAKRQALKNVHNASWLFGHPVLRASNNSVARWVAATTSPLNQKGGGWLAELYGGVQTGDDWAACYIPVNEYPISHFTDAQWSYYMTATETMGVNIVFWVHDADDFDNRAEITQLGGHADLEKTSGWNAFEFTTTTGGMFYYGEGTTGTLLTAGTQYTWAQFQADKLFENWVIYRITFEYGWEASGTFDPAYLAEVKLNGVPVPLVPKSNVHRKTVLTTKTVVGGVNSADDVISNSVDAGTDWDFDFGGTGYITKAILTSATNAIVPRCTLQLYSVPPTCNLHDNVAATSPVAADVPYFVGEVSFPALHDKGNSHSYSIATPSTYGDLPIAFDVPVLYGVLISDDACTPGAVLWSILLTADMEDN